MIQGHMSLDECRIKQAVEGMLSSLSCTANRLHALQASFVTPVPYQNDVLLVDYNVVRAQQH